MHPHIIDTKKIGLIIKDLKGKLLEELRQAIKERKPIYIVGPKRK